MTNTWAPWLICGFLLTSNTSVVAADECGDAPNRNVKFTSNIRHAAASLAQNATNTEISTSAKVIYEGLPIEGFLNIDSSNTETLQTHSSDSEIRSYVQTEISNNRTALVAECMYFFCKASNASSQYSETQVVLVNAASEICDAAISGLNAESLAAQNSRVSAQPKFNYVEMFQDVTATLEVNLVNSDPHGSIAMNRPLLVPNSSVTYEDLETFSIDPSQKRLVKFSIKRPSADSGRVKTEKVEFPNVYGGGGAHLTFAVARERPIPLPPYCDYLNSQNECGQCTVHFDFTNVSESGNQHPNVLCPRMGKGSVAISWETTVYPDILCAGAGCARLKGNVEVVTAEGGSPGIPFNQLGEQMFGMRGSGNFQNTNSGEVKISFNIEEAYIHNPNLNRVPVRLEGFVKLRSLTP